MQQVPSFVVNLVDVGPLGNKHLDLTVSSPDQSILQTKHATHVYLVNICAQIYQSVSIYQVLLLVEVKEWSAPLEVWHVYSNIQ
jgi:hypothetical protein